MSLETSGRQPGVALSPWRATPPPDKFGHLRKCVHLKQVLDSKARENVLSTYKQAVRITEVATSGSSDVFFNKKDHSVVPRSKLVDLKIRATKCGGCLKSNFFNNYICMQCPHVGCLSHAHTHYKQHQHVFAIDLKNGLLYCFSCRDYVNDEVLEQIRSSRHRSVDVSTNYVAPLKVAVSGLKGFVNLGSTCFMSAILQSFIHNPIIKYQFFNNDFHYLNCESGLDYHDGEAIDDSNACITCSVDKIFRDFYTSDSTEGYGMTSLLTTAWHKKKSLAGFQEQDAHEFWQFLLNEFHSDHQRILAKTNVSESQCSCVTCSTFSGELESSIRCLNCDAVTSTVDPLVDLSLEVSRLKSAQSLSLYDCLDLFTKEEKLDVMYTCRSCSTKSAAIKSLRIKSLPPVVSFQLKRFEHNLVNDTSSKLHTSVRTPLFLDLTKYTSDASAESKTYELFTVVTHIGSVNTGHYIVMIKTGTGQWFKFDDSVISIVSQEEVVNSNAYLLFYITHKL